TMPFAQQYRMALWAEHLNVPLSAVTDGVASASLWPASRPGSRVRPYVTTAGRDPFTDSLVSWDGVVDPDADALPICPPTVAVPAGTSVASAEALAGIPIGLRGG